MIQPLETGKGLGDKARTKLNKIQQQKITPNRGENNRLKTGLLYRGLTMKY